MMHPQAFIQQAIDNNAVSYKEYVFTRGDHLCMEGNFEDRIFLIREGIVRAYVHLEDQTRTIRLAYAPDMIAALDSFYSENPSQLNLQCLKKTEVTVIHKTDFMEWIYDDTDRRDFYIHYLEQLAVQQLEREIDLLHSTPRSRYLRLIDRSPHVLQEVPHKYIADYLRMSPETLSRILKSSNS